MSSGGSHAVAWIPAFAGMTGWQTGVWPAIFGVDDSFLSQSDVVRAIKKAPAAKSWLPGLF